MEKYYPLHFSINFLFLAAFFVINNTHFLVNVSSLCRNTPPVYIHSLSALKKHSLMLCNATIYFCMWGEMSERRWAWLDFAY